jgi:hypothetical protein
VTRNRENATAVTHDDVLTLIDDFETGLFQSPNGPGDDLRQKAWAPLHRDFDLAHLPTF